MYYRHNLNYQYPEKCDEHMITVKPVHETVLDENYPYLQKGFKFKCQRVILRVLQHTLLHAMVFFRHGLKVHGRKKLKQYKPLMEKGLLTISNHVYMWDFISVMVALRPKIGYFPVWKNNVEGSNRLWIRMAGGIPVPTDNMRAMFQFKRALEEVFSGNDWVHFFPEGSLWFYYPDVRPFKKAVFKYAVAYDRPILPLSFSFRPRKGLWKLLGNTPLVDLTIGDPIYHDKSLTKAEAAKKLQEESYHVLQTMIGINPGDPTYNTDQNPDSYKKTM